MNMREIMRLCEAIESYVYHGTSRAKLASIARDGLIPQEPGAEGWYDPSYHGSSYEDDKGTFEPRIFAGKTVAVAREHGDRHDDGTVLRLPGNLDWRPAEGEPSYLYTTTAIPASAIEVLDADGQWRPIAVTVGAARLSETDSTTRTGRVVWFNSRTNEAVVTETGVHHSGDVKTRPEKYGLNMSDVQNFLSTEDYDLPLIDFMLRRGWVRLGAHQTGITVQARSLDDATAAIEFIEQHPKLHAMSPTYVDITPVVKKGATAISYKLESDERWRIVHHYDGWPRGHRATL